MEKKEMTLKEYQEKAMTTCLSSINGERLNKYGNLVGSYFPKEHYCFEQEDNLQEFVEMLKNRGYYIGEDGHIRGKKGVLSSKLMRNGYYMTSATYKKKTYYYMEHRVVWCWHNGAIPQGMVINHKDYNRANNCIDNLEMVSQKENVEYSRCHFNPCKGERGRDANFTNAQASAIKTLGLNCGWSISKIADLIGEKSGNVGRIIRGERYANAVAYDDIMRAYPVIVDYTRNREIGELDEIKNYLLGLNGEVGELTDIFKKILYHGKEYNSVDVLLELGDILYYLTAICNILNIDIAEIMMNNNAKLMARYKDGYSIKDSLNRIEDKSEDVAQMNLDKLAARKAVGTIDGNGDGIVRDK